MIKKNYDKKLVTGSEEHKKLPKYVTQQKLSSLNFISHKRIQGIKSIFVFIGF